MNKNKGFYIAILFTALLIATLACGTGYSTSRSQRGNEGQVIVKIGSLDGSDSTEIEINEDYSWETLDLTILVAVEAGSYQATFVDDDDRTVTLEASAGNPASTETRMTTDAFGNITLNSTASGAEGVVITIDFIDR